MITDLRNDMKAECEKFGEVRKVIVFDVSITGNSIYFAISFFTFRRLFQTETTNWYRNKKRNVYHNLSFIIQYIPPPALFQE